MEVALSQRLGKASKRSTHQWTASEDAVLVQCLLELVNQGWSKDNGFKSGYLQQLEKWMASKIPNCQIKVDPHIKSRMKTLKTQYREMADMLGHAASGFGWNDVNKCVTCDLDVWTEWLKEHKDAASLRNKPFPHYDELTIIFGKDRATGKGAEAPIDAVKNIEVEEATAKTALEAYNAMNSSEYEDMFNDVNLENFQESVFLNNTGNNESFPATTRMPTMDGETERARKNQKVTKGNVKDLTFVENMAKLGEVCEGAKQEISKLANCFQHLADNAKRKMQVYDVIAAIEGLSKEDALRVGAILATNVDKTNFLLSILDDMNKAYVQGLLNGSM
ncbi:hypothetical protein PTKIN_Ptkin11bG0128500 [Pterospermum kingtungense]